MKKVYIEDLKDWTLYLNDGYVLNETLIETIRTISKGFIDDIGFSIIGDTSVYLFGVDKKIDFDFVNKDTMDAMNEALNTHPDFRSGLLSDESGEICGAVIQMNSGVINVMNMNDIVIENDNLDIASCLIARCKLLSDCENNKVYGYLIPNTYFRINENDIKE